MKSDFSPSRRAWNVIMTAVVWAAAVLVIALTVGVIGLVLVRGIPHVSWEFLSTTASVLKGTDGILPAILNTLYVILLTLLIVLPLGVGAAVYLTEYASNRKLIEVIEFTNETLAGIPSIIYGLVGMLVFAQTMGFKTCLLSGSLTLVVMNLPTIIRTTQESLKTVPQGYREGALGLGAGKWHIIRTIVLPCSIDGIVTGCILAVGRIVGESAALLFTAGAAEVIAGSITKAYTSNGATLSVLLYLRAFEDGDFASAWGIGAVLLVLTGVLSEKEALASIHQPTIFLFAGVLALSDAIQKTGAGDVVADWMIKILGGTTNTYLIMAVFFLVPFVLTQVMSNLATLTIFIPLVTSACLKMGLDPRAAVVGVITASCISIMTPMAAPCQIMIIEPGGYKLKDYLKCGTPLAALLCMMSILVLPMMFPLYYLQ